MKIRPARKADLAALVAQSAEIVGGDRRDAEWFAARKHLVLVDGKTVVGHSSWTVHDEGYITWDETFVTPAYQKQGWGRKLMEARAKKTPGIVFGACKMENEPMVHLLASMGFHPCQLIPDGYADGPAMLWARTHGGKR